MTEIMESRKIPLKEFISHLENNGNTILKNCIKKNTQFSTKFIINKIIAQNEKQLGIMQKDKTIIEKPSLPEQWVVQQDWDQIQAELKNDFDLENLNFIEANQLAMRLNEYKIRIYQSIQGKTSSTAVKKVLTAVIKRITNTNSKLIKEHLRLSAEP